MRLTHCSLLAAMTAALATGAAAAAPRGVIDQAVNAEIIGAFSHGGWTGRCWRDGFLSGSDREHCVATLVHGNVTIGLTRTAGGVTAHVGAAGCPASAGFIGPQRLTRRDRTRVVHAMLVGRLAAVRSACGAGAHVSRIDAAPLRALLAETDDLAPPR